MGEYKRLALLIIVGACLIVGASAGHSAQAEPEEVVGAVARDFYPEYVVDADGRPGGFGIDLMNEVAKRAGLSVTYRVFETWSDLIAALERGDADLVPLVSVTRAREARILFTRPVVTSPSSLFVRQDTGDVRGWSDLAGRRVGVIKGGVSEEILSERETSARLVPYARLQDALFGLLSGEVDALVSFQSSVWKVSERARLADRIKVVGDPLTEVKRAIAVRQDLPGLRDRLDAAVAEFLDSSEYNELYSKWYAVAPSFWTPGRSGWVAGASMALLLLGMLVWQSLSLHAENRRLAESAPGKLPGARAAAEFPTRAISRTCGLIGLALGLVVLLGWAIDSSALKTVLPGRIAMQPWAATAIALAGGALLAATSPGRIAAATSMALASTALIIGLQTVLQYTTGLDLGTDRWLFPAAVSNQLGHPHPGRVAEITSIAFALLGTTLLLAGVERAWARGVFSTIGTVGLLSMATPLVGYLTGAGTLESVAFVTPISLHAALGLVVLFLGALALRPDLGWMALLSGEGPGAASARMLLPVAVVGPILLAWLFAAGKEAALYGPEFRVGLAALATMALLAASILWSAERLDRLHRARRAAAEALLQSEERYRTLVEAQPDPICRFLPDTTLTFVNRAYAQFYGREPEELIGRRWLDFAAKDERPRFLDELSSFTPTNPEGHEETRSTRADREVRWYLCHLYGFFDEAGKIVSFQTFGTDITPRKRAEERLAEQLGLLTAITDSAADAIFVSDGEDRVTFMNPAVERIFGWAGQELTGRKLHEAIHDRYPDGSPYPASECPLSRVYATGETLVSYEDVFFRKGGSPVQVACSNAPLMIEGRIAGSVLVAHDITERKRTEAALSESENRMRALLDASQDEILLVSIGGEVLAINKAAERRLGKRMGGADLVGAHLDRLLPQDQVEQRMAIVQQVASTATLVHCDTPIRSRWFEFWFYPVLRADRLLSEVAIYAREITEQKKSQADLSKLFQAIQQSPMSVVITDRDGNIEYVNPEFAKVTGYTPAEAVGQNPRILKSGHTPPELYANLWQTISAGGVWRGEFLNKKKNGELFWELASIAPVKEGEKVTNFVAVKEDITERREMEEQLRQSQKMQAVGQLTGGIAHDFNNLLAIVMGNLQLLEGCVSGDAKAREYLDDALWSARRGGELTHRLLAFARKQPLKPAVIDLNEVVRGMTDLLRRTLGASIRIDESLAPDLWKAFADRGELERALVNLAVNARDAMRSAGTLTVETHNAVLDEDYAEQYEEVTPGEYVLLAVADTGTGMPPESMQRVFEPFFTTKEVGQGSGLGLSMVYGFVKQSGGHVSIYSRVGQGTCVKLYLPRAPSSPVAREKESPDVFPEDLGNKVVLVVEDEAKLRKVAVKMLDRLGLQTLQAETAKDALELLADTHIDVLFTDIELPGGMNGTELADVAHQLYPEIKVLFTTGYARETALHERGLHERAPWLLKPYSHQELARELKALLSPTVH